MRTFDLAALAGGGALEEVEAAARAVAEAGQSGFAAVAETAGLADALSCLAALAGREAEVVDLCARLAAAVVATDPQVHGQSLTEAHRALPGIVAGGDMAAIVAAKRAAAEALARERLPGGAWRAPVRRTPGAPLTRDFQPLVLAAEAVANLAHEAAAMLRDGMSPGVAETIRGIVTSDVEAPQAAAMRAAFMDWGAEGGRG